VSRRCLVALVAWLAILGARPSEAQSTLSALQTDMEQIAQRARPAVVTVFAQRTLPSKPGMRPIDRRTRTRVGSGVAVEENGILTTASVVMNAERVVIRTANGLQSEAQVVGLDPIFNLALLRVSSVRLPAVRFGNSRDGQIGSWVISLGTSYRAQPTQSVGNVAYRGSRVPEPPHRRAPLGRDPRRRCFCWRRTVLRHLAGKQGRAPRSCRSPPL